MVRRTKEEAQETRRQILEAAEQAFFERGVSRTTLADIAALAGVTRGAIYWHFSNKADLVQAMLDSLHEPLEEMARASESADEILFHKFEFTDEMCDMRRQRQFIWLDANERIALALNNASRQGQLPADLNPHRGAICLHAYIHGILGQWLLVPDSFPLFQDAERLVDTVLDMLRYSPALRDPSTGSDRARV
jgi:TetR/AcrR family acrAB operon transcriptional repressor